LTQNPKTRQSKVESGKLDVFLWTARRRSDAGICRENYLSTESNFPSVRGKFVPSLVAVDDSQVGADHVDDRVIGVEALQTKAGRFQT
jgi:hypothetical protein